MKNLGKDQSVLDWPGLPQGNWQARSPSNGCRIWVSFKYKICKEVKYYGMNVQNNIRSIRRKPEEGMNKYCHSQIFWILEGARMSFVDFLPFSSARSPEIGLNGFWFRFFRRNSGVTPDIAAEEYAASYKDCWSRIRFRTSTCSSPIRDTEHEKSRKSSWWRERDVQPLIWPLILSGFSSGHHHSEDCIVRLFYWSYLWP